MATDLDELNGRNSKTWALLSPEGSYYKLKEPSFFIGRNGDVDLALGTRSIDKKHAVITILEEQGLHYIHDLDSINGTFVNEKRVQKSKLDLGDVVRFGYDMNVYRVDLYPCEDNKLTILDENDNSYSGSCYQGVNDMNHHHHSDETLSRTCHSCGSKSVEATKESRPVSTVHGSNLYGQPSWWGWGSSDEEIYTYPNCATVVTPSGTSQCTVLQQQRIKRNKTNLEHSALKQSMVMDTSPQQSFTTVDSPIERRGLLTNSSPRTSFSMQSSRKQSPVLRTTSATTRTEERMSSLSLGSSFKQSLSKSSDPVKTFQTSPSHTPTTTPSLTTRNLQEFSSLYGMPMFGAWESVPHGSYIEGLEDDSSPVEYDSHRRGPKEAFSSIPIVPDFGELPEKPVSVKSRRAQQLLHNKSDSSTSSPVSENSDLDYSPDANHRGSGGVFGLTEVTSLGSNSPKGVSVGKPKHIPVKIKPAGSKSSTTRAEKSRTPVRRNDSSSSVTKESSPKTPRCVARASSSGGSSIHSDNDSRGSGHTPSPCTSDDSDTDHTSNSPNDDHKHHKRKTDKSGSSRDREVYSADVTDKGQSSLPRVNKTALLRARSSREALKTAARRSSPLRSRTTSKTRHKRTSTSKKSTSSDSTPSSSLRIWSPSDKKPTKSPKRDKQLSTESPANSYDCNSSVGDSGSVQATVDEVFEAGTPAAYVLPKELQMNRNDANNRTFVLEEKSETTTSPSTTSNSKTSRDASSSSPYNVSSLEDTLQSLNLSHTNRTPTVTPTTTTLQSDRPMPRLPQPDIGWMTSSKGRSTSPESFVSVPPASSPSPPSSPRTSANNVIQERMNCTSAPPHSRRQWDITEKPVEDLMLSSVHAFTVELRLASEMVLSKARNLYEMDYGNDNDQLPDKGYSSGKQDSKIPEWKSSHAEIAGVFRNLRRVEFNLRTMDQALSYLCSAQDCQDGRKKENLSAPAGLTPRRWNEIKARARKCSWAEEHRSKFPGPPSDDEEVATS